MLTEEAEKIVRKGLSARMAHIQESTTLKIAARAAELRAQGRKLISLSMGEPDFPTPENIKEAGIKAIRDNFTKYTPSEGILQLRELLSEKFWRDNNIETTADRVQVTSGGKHALSNAVAAVAGNGDEVLIPNPYWISYPAMVWIADAKPRFLHTGPSSNWLITADELAAAITPRTKAIIMNTPVNPTSVMYSETDLRALVSVIEESGIHVIMDELYEKIVYDGRKHFSMGSIDQIRDQVITINGFSKAYAMTGWRLGYATGPADVMDAMIRIQSQAVSHPSSISQKAAVEALTGQQDSIEMMRKSFEHRRDTVVDLMQHIPNISFPIPQGAFYVFFDITNFIGRRTPDGTLIESADEICTMLMEHFGVVLVSGSSFGRPDAVRISFAASEADIREGVSLLQEGLSAIQ